MSKQTISEGVVHKLPPDLKKALTGDKAALAKWEVITPTGAQCMDLLG